MIQSTQELNKAIRLGALQIVPDAGVVYEGDIIVPNGHPGLNILGNGAELKGRIIAGGLRPGTEKELSPIGKAVMLWDGREILHINGRDHYKTNVVWVPEYSEADSVYFRWDNPRMIPYKANKTGPVAISEVSFTGHVPTAVYAAQCEGLYIVGCTFENQSSHGILADQCWNPLIEYCTFKSLGTKDQAGTGYAVGIKHCVGAIVQECEGTDVRYVVSVNGSRFTRVTNIKGYSVSGAIVDDHGTGSVGLLIENVEGDAASRMSVKLGNESWRVTPRDVILREIHGSRIPVYVVPEAG